METALAIFFIICGVAIFVGGVWFIRRTLSQMTEITPAPEKPSKPDLPQAEGPVRADGLVYLYAHDFIKPAPRRPIGSVARDRVYSCQNETELSPDDFAEQLLYAVLTELHSESSIQFRTIPRDPSYMPPYPQKQWELQLRQARAFPSSPLFDSLGIGFELARKNRVRSKKTETELTAEDQYFSLEEVLERSLKAIRQEMSFWERGTVCSDLRNYVANGLLAQGFLVAPDRDTWLDTVRSKRLVPNLPAIQRLSGEAQSLARRLQTFRKTHGSAHAINPEKDERGRLVDIDPAIINATRDLDKLPLDDSLRASIHEAIVAIKQLEPSGEAGI